MDSSKSQLRHSYELAYGCKRQACGYKRNRFNSVYFEQIKIGMSGEIQAFFFIYIMDQEESGRKLFSSGWVGIVVPYVMWVGKL